VNHAITEALLQLLLLDYVAKSGKDAPSWSAHRPCFSDAFRRNAQLGIVDRTERHSYDPRGGEALDAAPGAANSFGLDP
jgi:hypothetical protein